MRLLIGVELVTDKESEAGAPQCSQRGLLLPCGPTGIRFSPPVTVIDARADTAFEIIADALATIEGHP